MKDCPKQALFYNMPEPVRIERGSAVRARLTGSAFGDGKVNGESRLAQSPEEFRYLVLP